MGRGPVQAGGRVEQLMRKYPNLYGDLSAYSGTCAIMRDETYGLAFVEEFSERLFYATDTVNRHQIFPLGAFLDKCLEEGRLSERAWQNICFRNAQRVFAL
jgi:predicted TIM-barrel fold metal-dependent hydrolase